MFNRKLIKRIVRIEQINSDYEYLVLEVNNLYKINQSLQSQLDEMKRRFDNLQSMQSGK